MDYEKIHKLSLELGRKLIQENPDLREWVESKLPELAESEDEKIRKELVEIVETTGGLSKEHTKKLLAWLEEQKDKNCLACDQHLKGYIAGRKVTEEEKQKEQVMDETDKIAAAYQLGRSDERKQKEKKPVEWSEEDEKMLNVIINYIPDEYIRRWFKSWLKSLRPVKQEWSEEDIEWANEIRLALLFYSYDKPFVEKLTNWFDNHIQPNPHWKPSEKQIDWLWMAINLAENNEESDLKDALQKLYDDLKKL